MPFVIPKGWKSQHVSVEMSLNELWKGQKQFLTQFHKKPKKGSFKEAWEDNMTGYKFNPENVKEIPAE